MKTGFPRHLMTTCTCISGNSSLLRPFQTHVLALGDGAEVDLNLGHGQNVGGSRHVDQKFYQSFVSHHQLGTRDASIGHCRCITSIVQHQLQANGNVSPAEIKNQTSPTLNSALGTSGTDGTHGTDHEVGEELVLVLAALGNVLSKVGNVGTLGLAGEGTGVGRGGGAVGADGGGAEGASDRDGGPGSGAQADARSGREGRHRRKGQSVGTLRAFARGGEVAKAVVQVGRVVRSFPWWLSADDALPKVLGEKCRLRLQIMVELGNWRRAIGPVRLRRVFRTLPSISLTLTAFAFNSRNSRINRPEAYNAGDDKLDVKYYSFINTFDICIQFFTLHRTQWPSSSLLVSIHFWPIIINPFTLYTQGHKLAGIIHHHILPQPKHMTLQFPLDYIVHFFNAIVSALQPYSAYPPHSVQVLHTPTPASLHPCLGTFPPSRHL